MKKYITINEFPNYEINEFGEIRNIKTKRILKPKLHKKRGYLTINLRNNDKQKTIDIHRLVALTLIPNPDQLKYVDHIDRNSKNNHVSNLRWSSQTDNLFNRIYNRPLLTYCDINKKFNVQHRISNINIFYDDINNAIKLFKSLI